MGLWNLIKPPKGPTKELVDTGLFYRDGSPKVDLVNNREKLQEMLDAAGIPAPSRNNITLTLDERIIDLLIQYENDGNGPMETLVETLVTAYFQGLAPQCNFLKPIPKDTQGENR